MSYLRIIPLDAFEMTTGVLDEMSMYQFHNKICNHYFCPTCGVDILENELATNTIGVNARTLDAVDPAKLKKEFLDGKNDL